MSLRHFCAPLSWSLTKADRPSWFCIAVVQNSGTPFDIPPTAAACNPKLPACKPHSQCESPFPWAAQSHLQERYVARKGVCRSAYCV
ncbi:hypothetical protein PILCRDRAFT_810472 [Piloderma croceum F 1598]|uniref:Uncharacterized protein n=1 Tax=Piloderma croceum (strain F 1598) TaxID=765440 RepID=A0A0C3G862_PILCF|nr:hypothetical protein PILCRDRAFT_810472 [Piloderma croceum F 1598]